MKTNLWKYFICEEQTEAWLNDLASAGLNCVGSNFLMHRYSFEMGAPGEYAYRITIMDHGMGHSDTIRYLAFLQENGIEYIAHGYRHFILRKKVADGAFDLYTDRESQIKANRTLKNFSILTFMILIPIIGLNIGIVVWHILNLHSVWLSVINLAAAFICVALSINLCGQWRRYALRIKSLEDDSSVFE